MRVSGYKTMWLLVMFDLPTDTKKARRSYTRFRKMLVNDGFIMLQYSVYARPCPSQESTDVHQRLISRNLPPDGQVRMLELTDKQYGRMQVFLGKSRAAAEKPPDLFDFI